MGSCLMLSDNISEQRMAEGEDKLLAKDTGGEGGARGAPVSAGPCSLLAWPLGNLASLLTGVPHLPDGTQFRPPPAKPFGEPLDHARTCLGSIRSFLLAYLAVFYIHGGPNGEGYPAFGAAATFSWSWIWPLLLRNMAAAWAICGFWDWLMYLSPLAPRFKPFKIYPKLPTLSQVRHDAFWTSIGMVCATLLEAAYCWGVANHKIPAAATLAEAPFTHLVWILFMTHLREPHDYLRHRLLHPWRVNWLPGPDLVLEHLLHFKIYCPSLIPGSIPVQAHPQAAPQELQHDSLLWHKLPPHREHHLPLRWLPRRAFWGPPCYLRCPHGRLRLCCLAWTWWLCLPRHWRLLPQHSPHPL